MLVKDAGITVPETTMTLALQREALIAGLRPAMLYPSLVSAKQHDVPPVHKGFDVVTTDDGTFHFNPEQTSAEEIEAASRAGRLNNLLALGPYSKSDIFSRIVMGEIPCCVVEMAVTGHEVRTAWGTLITAPVQMRSMGAGNLTGSQMLITSPMHVLAARVAQRSLETIH
jgi:hypothetical protein